MKDQHRGYQEAALVDKLINEILQTYDIESVEYIEGYDIFIQALDTTMNILRLKLQQTKSRQILGDI